LSRISRRKRAACKSTPASKETHLLRLPVFSLPPTINANEDNRFLLAHLQMVLLCDQPSLRNVRRSLNKLPADLCAFYDVAMARIADQPEDRRIVVKKALSYLFCAKRPLNVGELLHAL